MVVKGVAFKTAAGILNKDANAVLQFNPDGTVFAANKKVLMVVDKAEDPRMATLPLDQEPLREHVSIDKETAAEVMKNVPQDRTFGGLLETLSIQHGDGNAVVFKTTDGKRARDIVLKKTWRNIPDVRESLARRESDRVVCLNRRRLLLLLQAIDKNFTDTSSGQSPVWLTIRDDETVLVSAEDPKTGLVALGMMGTYKSGEYPVPMVKAWSTKRKLPLRNKVKQNDIHNSTR